MVNQEELLREERFWDKVGNRWMQEMDARDLIVGQAGPFLSGSSVAFDYMMKRLGSVDGLRVLDYGSGSGWLSTYLAQRGARVDGFDISGALVDLGMRRAQVNGVAARVHVAKMIAERLEYPDNTFDRVVGISILHHIDINEGSRELHRVMKPGGIALFIEPLGESWLQNAARSYILRVHHGFVRAVDAEHPLTYTDIRSIGSSFTGIEYREFQFLEMTARLTGDRLTKILGLRRLDDVLLRRFPRLRRFCRLVVIEYTK